MPRSWLSPAYLLPIALLLAPIACGGTGERDLEGEESGEFDEAVSVVPAKGSASTLDIGEWNIEWFGAPGDGPADDALQLSNIRDVLSGADLDVWVLEEVVSVFHFNQLIAQLPGYAGLVSNDPAVTSGSSYYTSNEQKLAVVYKSSVATVNSAKLILTGSDYDFAGRPPLEVNMSATVNGKKINFIVIAVHAKAMGDTASYNRRTNAAVALKSYLDSTYPTQMVIVAGDFNDDVDVSITSGKPSPYKAFVDDSADYFFPTKALSEAGAASTVGNSQVIDHHMLTNEMAALYKAGTAEVFKVDKYIQSYGSTTTDHFPVLTRYATPAPGPAKVIMNEILANEPGSGVSGEFVEIVNVGGSSADLSGWTLSDGTDVRHAFPMGTALDAGAAIVIYGGASGIPAGVKGAACSTGSLNLNNGGDSVALKDGSGAIVDSVTYAADLSSIDGVSMNRNPDGTPGKPFVLHTSIAAASSSPGRAANGSSFGQ